MTELADWLQAQMRQHGYNQLQVAYHAGVSQGTISEIITKGHIPRVEGLFRLADHFATDRVEILRIAGHLPRADQLPGAESAGRDDDRLTWQLVQEFRRVPAEWKGEAINQIAMFTRLAKLPSVHIIGDDAEDEEEQDSDQTSADQSTPQGCLTSRRRHQSEASVVR